MDKHHSPKDTPEAVRKARQRTRAKKDYGAIPVTLWLTANESQAVRHYLTRYWGHNGNLRSRRAPAVAVAGQNTPAPSASQPDQLNLFQNVS